MGLRNALITSSTNNEFDLDACTDRQVPHKLCCPIAAKLPTPSAGPGQ